jgi:transposase
MTMSIVKTAAVTGGVDTHADSHVAAALDAIDGLLGVSEFPATPAGYARLPGWLQSFGTVCLVGIEGTGSYGAGHAAMLLIAAGDHPDWLRSEAAARENGPGTTILRRH